MCLNAERFLYEFHRSRKVDILTFTPPDPTRQNCFVASRRVGRCEMGIIHYESKKQDTKLLAITSITIIRFSKLFH